MSGKDGEEGVSTLPVFEPADQAMKEKRQWTCVSTLPVSESDSGICVSTLPVYEPTGMSFSMLHVLT